MAESMLLFAVRQDYGEHVFKYLAPPDAGRLEVSFTRELVFVPLGGGEELLRSVARLLHADAVKNGVQLVPLGEGRGGRITWATELLWIYLAILRARRSKKMISAGFQHTLVTTGEVGEILSFGDGYLGRLGHGDEDDDPDQDGQENEAVPRPIVALNHVVVAQVWATATYMVNLGSGSSMCRCK